MARQDDEYWDEDEDWIDDQFDPLDELDDLGDFISQGSSRNQPGSFSNFPNPHERGTSGFFKNWGNGVTFQDMSAPSPGDPDQMPTVYFSGGTHSAIDGLRMGVNLRTDQFAGVGEDIVNRARPGVGSVFSGASREELVSETKQRMATRQTGMGPWGRAVGSLSPQRGGGLQSFAYANTVGIGASTSHFLAMGKEEFDDIVRSTGGGISPELAELGVSAGVSAGMAGLSQDFLSQDPSDQLATIKGMKSKLLDTALKGVDDVIKSFVSNPEEIAGAKQKVQTVASDAIDNLLGYVQKSLGLEDENIGARSRFKHVPLRDVGSIQEAMKLEEAAGGTPTLSNAIRDFGGPEAAAGARAQRIYSQATGAYYEVGQGAWEGGGGGGGGGGGRGGMYSGSAGSMFYGMYMARRTFQMSIAPVAQQSDAYTNYMQQVAATSSLGGDGIGVDRAYLDQSVAAHNKMRSANEVFGGFQQSYNSMMKNPAAARMVETGSVAGGLAMGGVVGGSLLGMTAIGAEGAALGGLAAALPGVGLAAAGVMVGGQLAMEGYNAAYQPEEPATWGNLWGKLTGSDMQGERNKLRFETAGWMQDNGDLSKDATVFEASKDVSQDDIKNYIKENMSSGQQFQLGVGDTYDLSKRVDDFSEQMLENFGGQAADTLDLSGFMESYGYGQDEKRAEKFIEAGAAQGLSGGGFTDQASALASQIGLGFGTSEARDWIDQYTELGLPGQLGVQKDVEKTSGPGASFEQYFDDAGAGRSLAYEMDIRTTKDAAVMSPILAGASGQFGSKYGMSGFAKSAYQAIQDTGASDIVKSQLSSAMGSFMQAGANPFEAQDSVFKMYEAGISGGSIAGAAAGDQFSMADAAWSMDPGGAGGLPAMYDAGGLAMGKYNGVGVANYFAGQMGLSPAGNQYSSTAYSNAQQMQSMEQFMPDEQYRQSFIDGGFAGMAQQHSQTISGLQMASIGIQYQQIALKQNAFWGAGGGGTWDNPTAGSIWGLQDQLSKLQYNSQMKGYQYSLDTLEEGREFDLVSRGFQERGRDISRSFGDWNTDFNYQTSLMNREQSRETRQFQGMMSGLQFGWGLEDVNEAISRSSGYDRKQLVEQRDRMATTHNLQEGQRDSAEKKQEEMWAREDERYQKSIEYTAELRQLEDERYQAQTEHSDEMYELQKEHIEGQMEDAKRARNLQKKLAEEQRKLVHEQMKLAEAALGIQAAMLEENEKYQKNLNGAREATDRLGGAARKLGQDVAGTEKDFKGLITGIRNELNKPVKINITVDMKTNKIYID